MLDQFLTPVAELDELSGQCLRVDLDTGPDLDRLDRGRPRSQFLEQ